jgi:hypothetical protein
VKQAFQKEKSMRYTKPIIVLVVVSLLAAITAMVIPPSSKADGPNWGVYGHVYNTMGSPVYNRKVTMYYSNAQCQKGSEKDFWYTDETGYYQLFNGNGWWIVEDGCESHCIYVYENYVVQDFHGNCSR